MTRPKEYLELEEYHEKMFGPDREKRKMESGVDPRLYNAGIAANREARTESRIEALEAEVSRLKRALDAVITALEVKKSKP